MTREDRRRRGRLLVAALAGWALIVALVVTVSVVGGARQAGANPVGSSPGVYVGGNAGGVDSLTLGSIGAGGSPVTGAPGDFGTSIEALAINSTATEALVGFGIDTPVVVLRLLNVAHNTFTFSDQAHFSGGFSGIAMDPTNPNVGYVVTFSGNLYKVTIGGSSFSVSDITGGRFTGSPTSLAIAPNGGAVYAAWEISDSGTCGIDAFPVRSGSSFVSWQSPSCPINDVAVSPDGTALYAAAGSGRIGTLIKLPLPLSAKEIQPAPWPIRSIGFVPVAVTVSPDSGRIYTGEFSSGGQSAVGVYSPSGTRIRLIPLPIDASSTSDGIKGIALAPDAKTILAVGNETAPAAGSLPGQTQTRIIPVNAVTLTAGSPTDLPATFNSTSGPQDVAITPDQAPHAAISSAGAVQVGHAITFDATPSSVRYGSVNEFVWTFDDGGSATGQTVSHTFATVGSHSATVTETDSAGTSVPLTISGFAVDTAGQTPYLDSSSLARTSVTVDVTPGPPPSTNPTTTLPHHGTTTTVPHHAPGTPTLTLKPVIGPPGTIVTVTGTGFAHHTPITVSWSVSTGSVVIMSDNSGKLPATPLYILTPDVLGPRFATASSTSATAPFLVVPSSSEPGGDNPSLLFRSEGP